MTSVSFTRKCNTQDTHDIVLSDRSIFLLYAYGDVANGVPQQHVVRAPVSMNFFVGVTPAPLPPGIAINFFMIHGSLMALAWSSLVVPALLIARYFKKKLPTWFTYHWSINVLALLMVSVAFILAIVGKRPPVPLLCCPSC